MKAYVFPGQGAQFTGMGKDLYDRSPLARDMFESANEILGFRVTDIMFSGNEEELKQTRVTQPAIFLHSTILSVVMGEEFKPAMVAGHSLGEFSSLVANRTLTFRDGLILVLKRALAMQKACENNPSSMAAILGLEDDIVEEVCNNTPGVVVAANFNSPGQIVISGEDGSIDKAIETLKMKGARRALKLPVGGAFHSPLMEPARKELEEAIRSTCFSKPLCPVYQNVNAGPSTDTGEIRNNLVLQLTSPVRWTRTVINMIADGATSFTEIGPGNVLQGLIRKINKDIPVGGAASL
jgi:[acyl-carrier-protein] S-malonyltransferase